MSLPPFGEPILRACSCCGASVFLRAWRQRCDRCGGYVVGAVMLEVLETGIRVHIIADARKD